MRLTTPAAWRAAAFRKRLHAETRLTNFAAGAAGRLKVVDSFGPFAIFAASPSASAASYISALLIY
jgi:N-acetylmuramic acid 6-phosphate (MurNAc-6-P) etherase